MLQNALRDFIFAIIMLVKTYAAAVQGINAIEVTIEVNVTAGVRFFLVGLPDNAVKGEPRTHFFRPAI